ncbi:MAG: MarR family transcriptional regulator [Chloroflexi bacterium]|nr:MarR family transcriptional regulator [Chloroflexota bacterium]
MRQFLHFSEQAAQGVGLTPQQHQALLAVKGFPGREGITVGELAERLQIEPHSAVGLVNRLVSQGLVVRELALADWHQVYVTLTSGGAALLEQLTITHREELRRIKPQLNLLLEQLTGGEEATIA